MTITVDLRPEVQAELARQAASRDAAIEDYAASLLEQAAHISPAATSASAEKRSLVDICAMVRGLTDDVDFSRNPSTDRPVEL